MMLDDVLSTLFWALLIGLTLAAVVSAL